ncbi:hypothetical protein mRhiFer1_009809 [Rhinolophus ferrumequinum]|uniref:Uncharacterized protein n=1 Tax=Rhinolophus ferrumequinum TaxID=59479 RepID=A0A7J7YSQ8_RHIFE|nr:hypothetical protein mRhiFer1_009809 [Rhinolophus ferrumequinum]
MPLMCKPCPRNYDRCKGKDESVKSGNSSLNRGEWTVGSTPRQVQSKCYEASKGGKRTLVWRTRESRCRGGLQLNPEGTGNIVHGTFHPYFPIHQLSRYEGLFASPHQGVLSKITIFLSDRNSICTDGYGGFCQTVQFPAGSSSSFSNRSLGIQPSSVCFSQINSLFGALEVGPVLAHQRQTCDRIGYIG